MFIDSAASNGGQKKLRYMSWLTLS